MDFCQDTGLKAYSALMGEVETTPKPGLVDRDNSGAHRDMDIDTFYRSAHALRPYFVLFAQEGARAGEALELNTLRPIGIEAEEAMLGATGGVNTHKGALFSFGLLCAAAGSLFSRGQGITEDGICALCARLTAGICQRELGGEQDTHGRAVHGRYGSKGVRGEAESGFKTVRVYGLPCYKGSLAQGYSPNDAGVKTLLRLMANTEDTNILSRRDMAALEHVRKRAGELYSDFSVEKTRDFDRELIEKGISPGGSADLLAVTIFLNDICK